MLLSNEKNIKQQNILYDHLCLDFLIFFVSCFFYFPNDQINNINHQKSYGVTEKSGMLRLFLVLPQGFSM